MAYWGSRRCACGARQGHCFLCGTRSEESCQTAIGHRVVHGGPDYSEPTDRYRCSRRSPRTVRYPSPPSINPITLRPIRAILERQPHVLQVACFDTAFHRGHPEVADRFAIPEQLYVGRSATVRIPRSFLRVHRETPAARSRPKSPRAASWLRILAAEPPCAPCTAGKSLESTMGFTALDGLPMGTRPGQLDAGVVLYLMSEKGHEREGDRALSLQRLWPQGPFGHQQRRQRAARELGSAREAGTGLLRLPDRALHGNARCRDGRHRWVRVHRRASARTHQPFARPSSGASHGSASSSTLPRMPTGDPLISRKGSRIACYVIPTDEELMIASHTLRVLREHASPRLKEKRA